MMRCEVCGNDYDNPIQVMQGGDVHVFDCFECAIHALAPRCEHCGCQVIGHGVAVGARTFCCAHCARNIDTVQVASEDSFPASDPPAWTAHKR